MIGVGIIGLGTVGIGTYKILSRNSSLLTEKTGLEVKVVKIADIDLERDRGVEIDRNILTNNAYEVIADK
ncbi:MAG: homoserine dehydrogenase, partial [Deltaproteobacteria bacterium]